VRQARRRLSSTVSQTSVFSEQTEAYFLLFGCAFFVKRNPQAKQENLHKNPRGNRSGRQSATVAGKSLRYFCATGPWIFTEPALGDALDLSCLRAHNRARA